MSGDTGLSPFWRHVLITGFLCLAFFPVLPLMYLFGLSVYFGGSWMMKVLRTGPAHWWYYSVRRGLWSLALSLLFSLPLSLVDVPPDLQNAGSPTIFIMTLLILPPFWFVVLFLGSLPFRAYQRRKRQREAHAAELESARLALLWAERKVESDRRQQEQLVQTKAAQKRREDARAVCDMAYALVAPEIAGRFSKQDFETFVSKYMTDSFPPEQVEERAVQLKAIIRQHQEKIVPAPKFRSIQDLAVWFEAQKLEIETVQDQRLKATLLVQLKVRYTELTSQLLSEMSP
jgi:hypothetical protein